MNIMNRVHSFSVRHFTFPISNALFNRRGIIRQYNSLKRTQHLSQDELRSLQFRKTKSILEYAFQHVPFYRERFSQINFQPEEFKRLEDLRHIPPLTRDELINNRHKLIDSRWLNTAKKADASKRKPGEPAPLALFRGRHLVQNRSSGSTGAPTVFYENGSISAANWANELRLRSWFGIPSGSSEARLVRITIDEAQNGNRISMRLRRWLWNQFTLPGASLTREDLSYSANQLKRHNPKILWGATATLTCLAELLRESPELSRRIRPELVVTWAAPMNSTEYSIIKESFGCPVTNIYGGREVGHIGARCEHGAIHLNQETVFLEEEFPQETDPSELIATSLIPSPMPFIRYRMGDLGKLGQSPCSCGKSLQVLEELTGRTNEIYTSSSGFRISPGFWCDIFTPKNLGSSIKRFQIIYRPNDVIVVRIVRGSTYVQKTELELKKSIQAKTPSSIAIEFEYPHEIWPALSGKYQMVVNESDK